MIINKDAAIEALTSENETLNSKADQVTDRVSAVSQALSCIESGELSGEGYASFAEYIRRLRLPALKTHAVAYEALRAANTENIDALSALEGAIGGVIDTDELQRERDECQGQIDRIDASAGEGDTSADADVRRVSRLVDAVKTYDAQIAAANEYANTSAQFYEGAQQAADDMATANQDAASASFDAASGWQLPTIGGWTATVDENYTHARAYDWLCDNGTAEQRDAYGKAIEDGSISADDIYDASKVGDANEQPFNVDLYASMARLPDDCVTDNDVTAVSQAYMSMWTANGGEPDVASIDSLLEWSYVPDGTSTDLSEAYQGPSYQDPHLTGTVYGMERSSLFDRMAQRSGELLKDEPAPEDKSSGFWLRMQAVNTAQNLAADDTTAHVKSRSADHADIALTIARQRENAESSQHTTASMVTLSFDDGFLYLPDGSKGICFDRNTHVYIAGNANDATLMLQALRFGQQSGEQGENGSFDVMGAIGGEALETSFDTTRDNLVEQMTEGTAKETAKYVIAVIGIIAAVVEKYQSYCDQKNDSEESAIETKIVEQTGGEMDRLLNCTGVGFDLSRCEGTEDHREALRHPNIYTTNEVDQWYDDLAQEFSRQRGKEVTGEQVRNALRQDFIRVVTGEEHPYPDSWLDDVVHGRNEEITPKPPTKDYPTDATEEELDTYFQFFTWTNKPASPGEEANNGFGLVDRETGEGWDKKNAPTWFRYMMDPTTYPDYVPGPIPESQP